MQVWRRRQPRSRKSPNPEPPPSVARPRRTARLHRQNALQLATTGTSEFAQMQSSAPASPRRFIVAIALVRGRRLRRLPSWRSVRSAGGRAAAPCTRTRQRAIALAYWQLGVGGRRAGRGREFAAGLAVDCDQRLAISRRPLLGLVERRCRVDAWWRAVGLPESRRVLKRRADPTVPRPQPSHGRDETAGRSRLRHGARGSLGVFIHGSETRRHAGRCRTSGVLAIADRPVGS
jgi:hypothetical protein